MSTLRPAPARAARRRPVPARPASAAGRRCRLRRLGAASASALSSSSKSKLVTVCGLSSSVIDEVVARQAAHDRAVLVAHDDVDEDELGAGAEDRRRLRRRLRGGRQPSKSDDDQKKPQSTQRSQRKHFSLRAQRSPRFLLRRRHQNLNREQQLHAPHRPDRRHLAEGRRVDVRCRSTRTARC